MVDVIQIDHVTEGLGLLPSQWEDSKNLRGVLEAWLRPLNILEQDALDVRDGFNVYTAVGVQLDIIGAYFGVNRLGRTDDEYRSLILATIASTNGSGTPDQLMDLFSSIANTNNLGYWEHYPLSIAMVANLGDNVLVSDITAVQGAMGAGIEISALMYDPNGYTWRGAENVLSQVYLAVDTNDLLVDNLDNNFVVDAYFDEVDDGTLRSSFIDISVDVDPIGYGQNYGQAYGGQQVDQSQFCEASLFGNTLTPSGGNGFVLWAEQTEYDPNTLTTNKYKPTKEYQLSGIKPKQPVPRQFFNWMMATIDDWFGHLYNRTVIGTIRMTADPAKTATDFGNQFLMPDGNTTTWTDHGIDTNLVDDSTAVYVFERTA